MCAEQKRLRASNKQDKLQIANQHKYAFITSSGIKVRRNDKHLFHRLGIKHFIIQKFQQNIRQRNLSFGSDLQPPS